MRVSTEAQAEEGFSIEAQKQRLEAYCVAMGWKNYEFFVDGGYSGSNLDRPAMNSLISATKEGGVQAVAVYKLDRLSRSQKDTLFLIEDVFLPAKVDFISLNESIDTSTPYGRAMIGILSAFAQLERENIFLRTRMGMLERVKQGYWMGGGTVPFGYDYDKKQGILVVNPHKSAIVQEVYQLYLQGYAPQKIAEKLGLGYDRLVTQIIDRRTNLGLIPYKGNEYQGRHQPIISPEIFDLAQEKRKKSGTLSRKSGIHLLSGLIFCKYCGNRLRYLRWGKQGYKLRCYSLDKSKSYMSSGKKCQAPAIWAEEVEDIVVADLLGISVEFQEELLPSVHSLLSEEIKKNQGKLKRLYQLYAKDGDETLIQLIEEQKKQLNQLEKALDREISEKEKLAESKLLRERICSLSGVWEFLNLQEKQSIIRDCIERILIFEEEVEIFYTFLLDEAEFRGKQEKKSKKKLEEF